VLQVMNALRPTLCLNENVNSFKSALKKDFFACDCCLLSPNTIHLPELLYIMLNYCTVLDLFLIFVISKYRIMDVALYGAE
jgi:hypothetical protein